MKRRSPRDTAKPKKLLLPWFFAVAVFLVVIVIRVRLAGIPLERDEGEYAYQGQLLLQGIPPYKLAYSLKLPGTAMAYELLMAVFGQSITGIHLGLAVVNLTTALFVGVLGKRLIDAGAGIIAASLYALLYALLSLSPAVLGLAAHATQFVV